MLKQLVKILLIIAILCNSVLFFSSCGIDVEKSFLKGVFEFTGKSKMYGGTATLTKSGAKIDNTLRSVSLNCGDNLNFDLTNNGILDIEYKNTSDIKEIKFSFITKEDNIYTPFKMVKISIDKTTSLKKISYDLSAQYGWMGTLIGFRISTDTPTNGELIIKSLTLKNGGANYPPLKIGKEEILYTFRDRASKGIGMAPDGILGQWRNSDGTINFIGSNLGKIFMSVGTESEPFKTVKYSKSLVENVPVDFRYASIAQIYKDEESKLLIGITHLEQTLDTTSNSYAASIALSTSNDDGITWKYLGEIVTCNIPDDKMLTASRDAGNGTMVVKDGYMYIYITDVDLEFNVGLSVSKAKISDIVADAKTDKATKFYKWYNNEWNEPGIEGRFSNVLTSGDNPNFCYIQYNKILNKYILLTCTAPNYSTNDGDIAIYLSDTLTNFANPKYYIACGIRGEQYPSMVSFENDSQTSSGKEFYIYYCSWDSKDKNGVFDWQKLWGTANYIRRKVEVK